MSDLGGLERFRWCWKGNTDPVDKDRRLPLVRHRAMHHRAISVPLHMRREALVWAAPVQGSNLAVQHRPVGKAIEAVPEKLRHGRGGEVDDRIAQPSLRGKIDRNINEIVCTCKSFGVNEVQEHGACEGHRQITKEHRRQLILRYASNDVRLAFSLQLSPGSSWNVCAQAVPLCRSCLAGAHSPPAGAGRHWPDVHRNPPRQAPWRQCGLGHAHHGTSRARSALRWKTRGWRARAPCRSALTLGCQGGRHNSAMRHPQECSQLFGCVWIPRKAARAGRT
mmetsp:Transcript_179933/g.437782  ORF Transcript_179933/g.437782 Transcript_179933/m.437782 type:complete len:279 (-) Transcript_179933:269-1105(-)